jgi:hypothetical protein
MSTQIAKHLEFCAHLAAAVRDGSKTVTYKPLSPGAITRHAQGVVSEKVPYPVGSVARIFEPSGRGPGGIVFESSFTSKDATKQRKPPADFRPTGQLDTELTVTILASTIVKLSSITEADARLSVVAPAGSTARAEFERQWRAAYRGPQAWEQDPLCWRIDFAIVKK